METKPRGSFVTCPCPPGTLLLLVYYLWFHPNAAARPAAVAPSVPAAPADTVTAAGTAAAAGAGTGTLRSLKGHAAGRVSAVRYVRPRAIFQCCLYVMLFQHCGYGGGHCARLAGAKQ